MVGNLERGRGRMRTKNNCGEVRQSVVGNLETERSRENENVQRIATEKYDNFNFGNVNEDGF